MSAGRPVRLSHLFVHVRDIGEARRFYVDLLGLELLVEEPGYLRVGGGDGFHIGMEEVPDRVGSDGIEIVAAVADVGEAFGRLAGAGVSFEAPSADQPWGARHAWLRDPSGYRLSIYRSRRKGAVALRLDPYAIMPGVFVQGLRQAVVEQRNG